MSSDVVERLREVSKGEVCDFVLGSSWLESPFVFRSGEVGRDGAGVPVLILLIEEERRFVNDLVLSTAGGLGDSSTTAVSFASSNVSYRK